MIAPPDCMVDIETVDTKTTAAIVSIAAVRFDALGRGDNMQTLELLIDLDDCFAAGLTYDDGTIAWWSNQTEAVKYKAFEAGPRLKLADALVELRTFVAGSTRLWCQGMNFDTPILENAYRAAKVNIPWNYWQWRDSRTLLSFFRDLPKKDKNAHDALYDATWQAKMVQHCLKKLELEDIR
jgi:hypothetical protein